MGGASAARVRIAFASAALLAAPGALLAGAGAPDPCAPNALAAAPPGAIAACHLGFDPLATLAGPSAGFAATRGDLAAATLQLYARGGLPADAATVAELHARADRLPERLEGGLAHLLLGLLEAQDALAARPDASGAREGSKTILRALAAALPTFRDHQGLEGGSPLFTDPYGLVQLGGAAYAGNRIPVERGAPPGLQVLSVDLGGDDVYTSTAGGAWVPDVNRPLENEVGVLGRVSVALDLGGDDLYPQDPRAPGPRRSQGSGGPGGIGILVEMGGNDRYNASELSQGFGEAGVGLLLDLAGNDAYASGTTSQGVGQGAGIGLLLDVAGNDVYAASGNAQGFGLGGGVGLLLDLEGSDRYTVYVEGLGASRSYGQAVFLDAMGSDVYAASARAFGAPVPDETAPLTIFGGPALFLDRRSFDAYPSTMGSMVGNDRYWQQWASLGAPLGLGVDFPGTSDSP